MAGERILDFAAVCRACLRECDSSAKLPLDDVKILVKFAICTSVPVHPDDDLPRQICTDCWAKCRSWHEFHSMCQENQRVLKTSVNQTTGVNDHIKPEPIDWDEEMVHDPLGEEFYIKDEPIDEDLNYCSVDLIDEESVYLPSDPIKDESQEGTSTHKPPKRRRPVSLLKRSTEKIYKHAYDKFKQWQSENNCSGDDIDEDQLLSYFIYLKDERKVKLGGLNANYTMLKSVLYKMHNIDLSMFPRLVHYTKRRTSETDTVPQELKFRCLTKENIRTFLKTAPDEENLDLKVILILTVAGDLGTRELYELEERDVVYDKKFNKIEVNIRSIGKSFRVKNSINFPFVDIIMKYNAIASSIYDRGAFLMTYDDGKCFRPRRSKEYIRDAFKAIALKLGLNDAEKYMGRATSLALKVTLPKYKSSALELL